MPLIFLTSGSSWQVPIDCFMLDWVDTIGAGGGGYIAANDYRCGGGGGWSRGCVGMRVTPGSNIPYGVGAANNAAPGGDTFFNATSLADAQSKGASLSSAAQGGGCVNVNAGAATALGGQASQGVGSQKYSGGNSGTNTGNPMAGGGGAAGPNGNGGNGSNGANGGGNGWGGTGDAGFGGAGGGNNAPGGNGNEYGSGYGSGGGGGGRALTGQNNLMVGGQRGGGAGVPATGGTQIPGGAGLIVLSYTPGKGGPSGFNMPMMGL